MTIEKMQAAEDLLEKIKSKKDYVKYLESLIAVSDKNKRVCLMIKHSESYVFDTKVLGFESINELLFIYKEIANEELKSLLLEFEKL